MTKWLGNGGSDLCCEAENHTLAKHHPQAPLHRLMCSANDIPPVLFLSQLSSSCWGCILWRRVTSDRLSLPSPLLLTLSSWLPSNSSPRKGSLKGWSRGAGKAGPVAPSHATPVLPSSRYSKYYPLIPLFTFQHCLNKLHKSRGWSNLYTDNSCSLSAWASLQSSGSAPTSAQPWLSLIRPGGNNFRDKSSCIIEKFRLETWKKFI